MQICEDNDGYYDRSLISQSYDLGIVGKPDMWGLLEPGSDKLALHILHRGSASQVEFRRTISFCLMRGRKLSDVTDCFWIIPYAVLEEAPWEKNSKSIVCLIKILDKCIF